MEMALGPIDWLGVTPPMLILIGVGVRICRLNIIVVLSACYSPYWLNEVGTLCVLVGSPNVRPTAVFRVFSLSKLI